MKRLSSPLTNKEKLLLELKVYTCLLYRAFIDGVPYRMASISTYFSILDIELEIKRQINIFHYHKQKYKVILIKSKDSLNTTFILQDKDFIIKEIDYEG